MVQQRALNGRLIPAAVILGVSSLISRGVGLLRERVLTTTFGAGDVFDAFVAAFRVPDLVFNLVVLGALSASFIPLFTGRLVRGKDGEAQAWRFALTVLNVVLIAVGVLALLYALLAPWIVRLLTPGFSGEKLALTVHLSRIMAWQPILLGASFVFSGVLNSYRRFVAYALAPVLYNLGIIAGVLWLVPSLGTAGLAWGVVMGAVLHLAVQVPSMVRLGFRWRPILDMRSREMAALFRMMLPRVVGLGATQVNLLTVTVLGSTLLAGSLTAFHLANNLQYVPIGIVGIAFAQAAFPAMAEYMARGQRAAFLRVLTGAFRYILFLVVPLSLFMYLLRAQTIRVFFGDGAFDWEDTILTLQTLGWLTFSIFAQAVIPLLARAFYVQQDTKTPVIIAVVSMIVNVAAAVSLSLFLPSLGVEALAIAFSLSALVNMSLLLIVLHKRLGGFDDARVLMSALRIALAALGGGAVLQLLKEPVAVVVAMDRFWGVATQLIVTAAAGAAAYLLFAWLLNSPELKALKSYLPRRVELDLASGIETPRFGGLPD
ncbi:MAG: murein biosynthesis integral membrane protein MurJ [Candidatus Andersenbacteria bacterium]|nr:murein biosynthesis integral membrane protein MurJ [Candidatus Andersenbacteria bacterium]